MGLIKQLDSRALNLQATHAELSRLIKSDKPFLLGRPGGTESEGLYTYVNYRLGSRSDRRKNYTPWYIKNARLHSAITAKEPEEFDRFSLAYLRSVLSSDVLSYGHFAPGSLGITRELSNSGIPITRFDSLDPLAALHAGYEPWTRALESKRVLIVSPFHESIPEQYSRKDSVTGVSKILPGFSLEVVSPPWVFLDDNHGDTWHEHFSTLVDKVKQKNFDVAIIGASSFGLPLGSFIKSIGRQAIHLGGTTQLLFGIRGNRWEGHPVLGTYFDDTWVRPTPSEKPEGRHLIEGAAYW